MKIVILDAYTANPGDLDWEAFNELGHLQIYDRTSEEAVIENAADAEIVLTVQIQGRHTTQPPIPTSEQRKSSKDTGARKQYVITSKREVFKSALMLDPAPKPDSSEPILDHG